MTPQDINPWLSTILSLIAVGGFLWNHLTSGGSKALAEAKAVRAHVDAEIKALRGEIDAADKERETEEKIRTEALVARFQLVDARLLKIESDLAHLPDRDQTHRLELAVERLSGRLETLDERLKPVAAISDRLQEFLLEQARP